jgi:hypothetical protein
MQLDLRGVGDDAEIGGLGGADDMAIDFGCIAVTPTLGGRARA